ncbi:MAG: Eco57I restriction-modification methylase domain-containing protein [Muribaculaceae bacterium]|jgi:hypothetical protein|nr:Eco57I restriction-modification methylase domain-containing protein [Muribaculaceae bacterium]
MDSTILNNIIIGRVEPHIYAFSTQTVPNYLKVGDTYRPIEQRLNEWRKYFPNLEKEFSDIAKVNDATYFRDFAIHYFLENERKLKRLMPNAIADLPYYSKEFFKNASVQDIKDALADIKIAFEAHTNKYQFYLFDNSPIPITYTYERVDNYEPRPNQDKVIDNFNKAVKAGRSNLLMYAVMRFGKSFTSMCCATEMNDGKGANLVVVVSAKADVKQEWKRTVESHVRFKDYVFMDSDSLLADENALSDKLKTNKVVVFLTLQDLMGSDIKAKHKQIFENEFDLLIVDESHYGARASEYGKVLRVTAAQLRKELDDVDSADEYDNNETLKTLKSKVRLHLSGTPYRILMGDEFTKDDIIAFYQFTDIVKDQEDWNKKHLLEDDVKEWDNPYYGFPQMVRFAFNPNESSIKKMEELKKNGTTYAFSELFSPQSITKDNSSEHRHKKFLNEQEVLELLEVIDGSKSDENVLGFLDYDKIKEGKMCRHIVCVLPYRASCDALETLITDNKDKFRNLKDYEIINIAGVDDERTYKEITAVKDKINDCESNDKKTLTLTVNRMLTGSTVEQWDTMIYLKDTASPQEYDQAIFRLQNQYIRKYKDDKGDVIKYNMKPQTLLVDFNPNRMFHLQEQKSQIYNVNVDKNGNSKLEERIKDELRISPIILLNKNKLKEVVPEDILDAVREYSAEKSVMDEATDIPVDMLLLKDEAILKEIEGLRPIDSPKGIDVKAVTGEGDDMETPEDSGENGGAITDDGKGNQTGNDKTNNREEETLDKKLATYYAQILFFAFLTDSNVKSLEEIISVIDENDNNKRLANNVGLKVSILKIIQQKINPFILSKLDYKIQNLNTLMKDTSLQPDERVEVAMKKFGRLSSSEIVTPMKVAKEMVDVLPEEDINENTKILDIASKQGEFTRAIYSKFGDKIKKNIYAIPTSTITYEFTHKVYSLLGMPIKNVFSDFTSYDLIDNTKNETIIKKLTDMKFDAIIGNPPYQEIKQGTSDNPIYYLFMDVAFHLSDKVTFITPARFLFNAGKTPKEWNHKVLHDEHFKIISDWANSSFVFPNVDIKGGVVVTYRDAKLNFGKIGNYTTYSELNSILEKVLKISSSFLSEFVYAPESYKFSSKLHESNPWVKDRLSKGHLYDITSNIFEKLPEVFIDTRLSDEYIGIYGRIDNNRVIKWIKKEYIKSHDNLNSFKVFLPKSNGAGTLGEVLTNPVVGEPAIGHTQTFISIGNFQNRYEADALLNYLKTKFARTLLDILKVTQDNKKSVWKYVPLQNFTIESDIDWSKSISDIDKQLYKKYNLSEDEINFIESMIKPME